MLEFCSKCRNLLRHTAGHGLQMQCHVCRYIEPIRTLSIYTDDYRPMITDQYPVHADICEDKTLARSLKITCPNSECPSRDPTRKVKSEVVLFHYNSDYTQGYICCICRSYWKQSVKTTAEKPKEENLAEELKSELTKTVPQGPEVLTVPPVGPVGPTGSESAKAPAQTSPDIDQPSAMAEGIAQEMVSEIESKSATQGVTGPAEFVGIISEPTETETEAESTTEAKTSEKVSVKLVPGEGTQGETKPKTPPKTPEVKTPIETPKTLVVTPSPITPAEARSGQLPLSTKKVTRPKPVIKSMRKKIV